MTRSLWQFEVQGMLLRGIQQQAWCKDMTHTQGIAAALFARFICGAR